MLLGYVDEGEASRLMTIDVKGEGTVWKHLLKELKDDKIQYGYAKVEFENITKLFLIHWIGKNVSENQKEYCVPHLNEVRNLVPTHDLLVSKMDILEVQSEVQCFLYRRQLIHVNDTLLRSQASSRTEGILNMIKNTEIPPKPSSCVGSITIPRGITVKVAIIGRSGVGKTFIYLSYKGGGYALTDPQGVKSSVAADYMCKDVTLDKHNFTLEIWDTAGQERFVAFAPVWTRHAKVVICVYDITDEISYKEIPKHMYTAKQYANPRAIFFLVGNKADLVHHREVQEAEAERFAIQHDMMFIECSGLTGLNIIHLFENITRRVVFIYPGIFNLPSTDTSTTADQVIRLEADRNLKAKEGCKC